MEDGAKESLDGSSIRPVSSLLSHFEHLGTSNPSSNPNSRPISPRPQSYLGAGTGDPVKSFLGKQQESSKNVGDNLQITRGRETETADIGGLHHLRATSSINISPSPTRGFRTKPTVSIPPAVTIQPPQSPSRGESLNLNLSSTPTRLSADTPLSATSGSSSPRQFTNPPSRPLTPHLESRKSPGFSPSQPPSPPPPRRSGEIRRNSSFNPLPPPVNRAEKPKIASKPSSLGLWNGERNGDRNGQSALDPSPGRASMERSSPFSTPPSSNDSTPENEIPAPLPPRPKPNNFETGAKPQSPFEPPPVHHMVMNKRKNQEFNGLGRGFISPQVTGDRKPTLPKRPPVISEAPKLRSLPPPAPGIGPRPSMDQNRPVVSRDINDGSTPYAASPKRVSSTPINQQSQSQLRPKTRSMTVSERTPDETRSASSASHSTPNASSAARDYPDFSQSNRRPPVHKQGRWEIDAERDSPRIMDVFGEFLCAASTKRVRLWSLLDGALLMDMPYVDLFEREATRVLSVAFRPMLNPDDEGSVLWLGNSIGEIIEIDLTVQDAAPKVFHVHTRREVIQIHRHQKEMWTIDESGALHLWFLDANGSMQLSNNNFRMPKGQTFSMVVDGELWQATGKDIRVFAPTKTGSRQFQVLQRPFGCDSAGPVISGTTLSSQSNCIYFGHTDGWVSMYTRDYQFIGLLHISLYKITSLVGVGGLLWAGFSTGMIYVYDTSQRPWVVKKDWHAHREPIVKLIANRSSPWKLDRSLVISLGQDNMFRIWDGLLQTDWLENQMQSQEQDFCNFSSINTLVMTWNAGASTPTTLRYYGQEEIIRNILQNGDPDILVFGFQELVDLEDKTRTAKSFFKSKKKSPNSEHDHMSHQYREWRDLLTTTIDDYLSSDGRIYHLLHTSNMVGLFTCIYVKAELRERIRNVNSAEVKRGMGGLHGNKGALVVRFVLDDTSMCFINCHLAAGQTQTKDRNADITAILDGALFPAERDHSVRVDSYTAGGDGTMILDHEICVLNGDLNYRIDTMTRDTVVSAVRINNLQKLIPRDQLLRAKINIPSFKLRAFHELPITFAPTYKYDVHSDTYDSSEKRRAPAWCDRIMYRQSSRIQQLDYQRHEITISDHRPVTARFDVIIKTISPKKREQKWEECKQQLVEMRDQQGKEMMFDYLTNVLALDAAKSKQLIAQKKKVR